MRREETKIRTKIVKWEKQRVERERETESKKNIYMKKRNEWMYVKLTFMGCEQRLKNAQFIFHKSYIPHAVSCSKHIWLHPHRTLHHETDSFFFCYNQRNVTLQQRIESREKKNFKTKNDANRIFFYWIFSSFMELLLCHFTNPYWK